MSRALADVPALAQDETTIASPVIATGTFNSGKNGQDPASLTVSLPSSDISCPPGQGFELASVTYTNVVLTDTTDDESISVDGFSTRGLLPRVSVHTVGEGWAQPEPVARL
jgi:hypothetical protein